MKTKHQHYMFRAYAGIERDQSRRAAGSRRLRRHQAVVRRTTHPKQGCLGPDRPSDYRAPRHQVAFEQSDGRKPNHAARAVDIDQAFGVVRDPTTGRIKW